VLLGTKTTKRYSDDTILVWDDKR